MQVWQAIEKVLLEDQLGPGEDAAGQQFTELAPLKPQLQLAELSCAVPQLHIPDPAFAAHTQDCCKVRRVELSFFHITKRLSSCVLVFSVKILLVSLSVAYQNSKFCMNYICSSRTAQTMISAVVCTSCRRMISRDHMTH